MGSLEMMNPAELHRECVRLEESNDKLYRKLEGKDSELRASWNEIQTLERARSTLRGELETAQYDVKKKNSEIAELSTTIQDLIGDHNEWRDREVSLQRQVELMRTEVETWKGRHKEVTGELKKMESTIKQQDMQIQQHLVTREQVSNRMHTPVSSRTTQTDWALDETEKKLITAESVANAGMNEARNMKVELQQLKRKLGRLEASNARANEACNAYKTGCEALQEEIEHLSKEVATARQEHASDRQNLLSQLRASEQRERDLHSSIETIKKRDMSVEEARNEVETLGTRTSEALRRENQNLRDETQGLHTALVAARSEGEDYQRKYLHLMKTLQAVREQADEHRRQTSEDIQGLNRENAEVFNDYNRVRDERGQLRDQLRTAEKRIQELMARNVFKAVETQTTPADEGHEPNQQQQQLVADLEQEVMVQRNHADKLQSANSQLAAQANALVVEVSELKKERMVHATSGDASPARGDKLEIERLTQQVANLRDELERKRTMSPPPPLNPPNPPPPTSPPTRLQVLADDLEALQTPPPAAAYYPPPTEAALTAFETHLVKLITKGSKILKSCNAFRVHLEEAVGEQAVGGIPIHPVVKYPGQNWNRVFEVMSGIKLCLKAIEEKGMAVISQNVVMKRQLLGGQQQRVYEEPREEPHEVSIVEQRQLGQSVCRSDGETDSTASSHPGEDLQQCTHLIQDTDTLLRAAHGTSQFWGDQRIDNLRHQLHTLKHEVITAPAALPSPLPEAPPAPISLPTTSPIRRTSSNTMRWDTLIP